ncbi:MAG: hypothetical protein JW729_05025 [Bacteroidales bacterium]|nr:hypothetical protein [Bacteroidales bacterium]
MTYLWLSKSVFSNFVINFIDVFAGYQKANTLTIYGLNTIGVNPLLHYRNLRFNGAAYFQFGKNGLGNTHRAHIYTANLSYARRNLTYQVGYDHYSGKKYTDETSTDRHFIQLMETIPHLFLGFMDFTKGTQFQKEAGITDLNVHVKYGFKTSITAYYHALAYAQKPSAGVNRKIGDEFDFVLAHSFAKNQKLSIGYSFMLPHTDLVNAALGMDTNAKFAQWAWVMLTFTPKLL